MALKFNTVGPDGDIFRYYMCHSRSHWARNCHESYENTAKKDDNSPECVQVSLFMRYTSDTPSVPSKPQTLVDESECGAVIDTGCSTLLHCLQSYKEPLNEYERNQISE